MNPRLLSLVKENAGPVTVHEYALKYRLTKQEAMDENPGDFNEAMENALRMIMDEDMALALLDDYYDQTSNEKKMTESQRRAHVMVSFYSFIKDKVFLPKAEEFYEEGVSRWQVRASFGNYSQLLKETNKAYGDKFGFFSPEDFTAEAFEKTKAEILKYKRLFVISAQAFCEIRVDALMTIKKWEREKNGKLVIIPIGKSPLYLDKRLRGEAIITDEVHLNSNLKIEAIQINPRSVRPTSNLTRISRKSVIYGSTKLTKESLPTDIGKLPHLKLSTASLTLPDYRTNGYDMRTKSDQVAYEDHNIGGYIVEVPNDVRFFERPVEIDTDGSFVDLYLKPTPGFFRFHYNRPTVKEAALHLSVGDWHHLETSQSCFKIWPYLAKISKAKTIGLHDFMNFNGHSHHTKDDKIVSAFIEESGLSDVEAEFQGMALDLKMWAKNVDKDAKIYVIDSNHNDHVARAVKEATLDRPGTMRSYLKLALAMLDGKNVLEYGLKEFAGHDVTKRDKVVVLKTDERFVLENEMGEMSLHRHGHRTADGTVSYNGPSSKLALETGAAISGHTHRAAIHAGGSKGGRGNGGLWVNGTSTCVDGPDRPEYTHGSASSWLNTSTFVFGQKAGRFTRTQVTIVFGKYHLDHGSYEVIPDRLCDLHAEIKEELREKARKGLKRLKAA